MMINIDEQAIRKPCWRGEATRAC